MTKLKKHRYDIVKHTDGWCVIHGYGSWQDDEPDEDLIFPLRFILVFIITIIAKIHIKNGDAVEIAIHNKKGRIVKTKYFTPNHK